LGNKNPVEAIPTHSQAEEKVAERRREEQKVARLADKRERDAFRLGAAQRKTKKKRKKKTSSRDLGGVKIRDKKGVRCSKIVNNPSVPHAQIRKNSHAKQGEMGKGKRGTL